jgi:hypothetical protein
VIYFLLRKKVDRYDDKLRLRPIDLEMFIAGAGAPGARATTTKVGQLNNVR